MIRFEPPKFTSIIRDRLHAMCAIPPESDDERDDFAYLPVDCIYTTGNGLSSLIVSKASSNDALMTIGQDSDVIFTHWNLAKLIKNVVLEKQTKWVDSLLYSPLPVLQHAIQTDDDLYPITGLNSLYLTLECLERGIVENIWEVNTHPSISDVYLSSYIHKLSHPVEREKLKVCANPYTFLSEDDEFKQHVYAGVRISPVNKNYRTFCERLPFKSIGIKYIPNSWVGVLTNKFRQFEALKDSTNVAIRHPDLFAVLMVCSVGLPASMLLDNIGHCTLIGCSSIQIAEMLVKISPLVDLCTSLMVDDMQITDSVSYFLDEKNADIFGGSL